MGQLSNRHHPISRFLPVLSDHRNTLEPRGHISGHGRNSSTKLVTMSARQTISPICPLCGHTFRIYNMVLYTVLVRHLYIFLSFKWSQMLFLLKINGVPGSLTQLQWVKISLWLVPSHQPQSSLGQVRLIKSDHLPR